MPRRVIAAMAIRRSIVVRLSVILMFMVVDYSTGARRCSRYGLTRFVNGRPDDAVVVLPVGDRDRDRLLFRPPSAASRYLTVMIFMVFMVLLVVG